ncbi:hypothetical protein DL766_002914 [Monosporascus sp. MC13-8B]|uniref:AAA+ ATPase domain-containing protein n=1 Tax=Monosporascus cannonballus TaxID=155416 RepID=A0ABY0H8C9_9PEZI|nr:hypothetical protein DL763_008195 [Monosporascus cannonballus]RYO87548.1 hypothetical protein DL762_004194 [Monosporascus cannonballus]RYP34547.1 hypothetical protein DL766_002914 [Monosporascus sp. MC13-8B]
MSDFEDEMDIDVPTSKDITFSSGETAKGKRSAANLPVEAEDSLPWVEKYRPVSLSDVSGHQDILATINKFVDSNRLPHLLLYGPPGTGKTSTILALARRIYGAENMRQMVLELNASDDRGIDVVREQIKTFASTKQIFTMGGASRAGGMAGFKLIVLDEADAMTNTAQMALRRIMEKYTANTRFCIIANYTHKLSPALLSRCTRFRFSPLKEGDIRVLVDKVIMEEDVKITSEATDALVTLSKGDMRRALNVLQACHASSTPMRPKDVPKIPDKDIVRDTITMETIYNCIAAPPPEAIAKIMNTLLATSDVTTCLSTINTLKVANGLALADIITALSEQLMTMEVKPEVMIRWLEGLAEIEYRASSPLNEQFNSVVNSSDTSKTEPLFLRCFASLSSSSPSVLAGTRIDGDLPFRRRTHDATQPDPSIPSASYMSLWASSASPSPAGYPPANTVAATHPFVAMPWRHSLLIGSVVWLYLLWSRIEQNIECARLHPLRGGALPNAFYVLSLAPQVAAIFGIWGFLALDVWFRLRAPHGWRRWWMRLFDV